MDEQQIYTVLYEAYLHGYIEINHKRVLTDVLRVPQTFYSEKENVALRAIATLIATSPGSDVQPEAADLRVHDITQVERYVSKSGNTTWKAFDKDGAVVYLRQEHREMLQAAGLWYNLNAMAEGATWEVDDAQVHTVADGDFRKPVQFDGAWRFSVNHDSGPDDVAGELPANKRDVIDWADKLTNGDFLVLDTETTGLEKAHPVEIAVIDQDGNVLFNERIFPPDGVRIEREAAKVHGITQQVLEGFGAKQFADVADELTGILTGKTVVIYSAAFDVPVLHRAYERAGLAVPEFTDECALEQYAAYNGDWNAYHESYRWVKLTQAADALGVQVENAHSALGDAQMTLGVVNALAALAKGKDVRGKDIPF